MDDECVEEVLGGERGKMFKNTIEEIKELEEEHLYGSNEISESNSENLYERLEKTESDDNIRLTTYEALENKEQDIYNKVPQREERRQQRSSIRREVQFNQKPIIIPEETSNDRKRFDQLIQKARNKSRSISKSKSQKSNSVEPNLIGLIKSKEKKKQKPNSLFKREKNNKDKLKALMDKKKIIFQKQPAYKTPHLKKENRSGIPFFKDHSYTNIMNSFSKLKKTPLMSFEIKQNSFRKNKTGKSFSKFNKRDDNIRISRDKIRKKESHSGERRKRV